MSALVLYNYELDESCYKVRLALSLLGLDWQAVAVDVFPGKEHLTPPYLAMNRPIDRIDPIPNKQGSPGIFADAQFGAYFDNIKVTPN